jgi:transcriptional regulator with XRE-family HTH domain
MDRDRLGNPAIYPMATTPPSYLCMLRKQWALSQSELGHLVGVTGSAIGKYELRKRIPTRDVMLALEVVFGKPARVIFAAHYERIEDRVLRRASRLDKTIRAKTDPISLKKQKLLKDMADRMGSVPSIYDGSR